MGRVTNLRLDDAAQAGAGQLDLAKADGGLAVVVDGDGGVPDLDAVVAEIFGTGDKARLADQRQADELSGDALHAGSDVGDERGIDETVKEKKDPGKTRHQPGAESNIGKGREHIDTKRQPDGDVAPARRRLEEQTEIEPLSPLLAEGFADMPEADEADGQPQADAEAHVKIEAVGKHRIDRAHARMPAVQDAVTIEDRIGDDGDDQADKAADNRPERQDHADEHQPEIELDTGGHGRQVALGIAGQVEPGDGDEADRFGKEQAGQGRQEDIEKAEDRGR